MSLSFLPAALVATLIAPLAVAALSLSPNLPPSSAGVRMLGKTKDPNFNVNIYRDSGSSVFANGYHMMIFADTIVDKNGPTPESQLTAHNSLAYFGYDDPSDPTIMHDFGSQIPHTMDNVLDAPVATRPMSNETSDFGIWPGSNMAVLSDGVTAVGMFPLMNLPLSLPVYNTMVTIKVQDPKSLGNSNPPTHRVVDQFFYANEPLYGSLSIIRGLDGLLYMYASVPNGVKLARVQESQMTDRSKFEYWNGETFQSKMPEKDDASANVVQFRVSSGTGVIVGPDVGDVFWSDLHKTYLMVFMDASVNGQYWVAYSPDATLTKWSTPEKLWRPMPNPTWSSECDASGMGGKWNYAGHAHPHWDPSGKTLLLSWSSCTTFVNMAVLTWKNSGFKPQLEVVEPTATTAAFAVPGTVKPTTTSAAKSEIALHAVSTHAVLNKGHSTASTLITIATSTSTSLSTSASTSTSTPTSNSSLTSTSTSTTQVATAPVTVSSSADVVPPSSTATLSPTSTQVASGNQAAVSALANALIVELGLGGAAQYPAALQSRRLEERAASSRPSPAQGREIGAQQKRQTDDRSMNMLRRRTDWSLF